MKKKKKKKLGKKLQQKALKRRPTHKNAQNERIKKGNVAVPKANKKEEQVIMERESSLERIEFFRDRYALLYHAKKERPSVAWSYSDISGLPITQSPMCKCGNGVNCEHLKELKKLIDAATEGKHHKCDSSFKTSFWYDMASCISGISVLTADRILMSAREDSSIEIRNPSSKRIVCNYYGANETDIRRFRERFPSSPGKSGYGQERFMILRSLADSFLTTSDRMIINRGNITPRLLMERSFWIRLAYHIHWEFNDLTDVEPVSSTDSSDLILIVRLGGKVISRIAIPETASKKCLDIIGRHGFGKMKKPLSRVLVKPSLRVEMEKDDILLITPALTIIHPDGRTEKKDVAFIPPIPPGGIALIDGIGLVEMPEQETALPFNTITRLAGDQIPNFIMAYQDILAKSPAFDVAPEVLAMKIYDIINFDLTPRSIETGFCEFTISCSAGESDISIYEILRLRKERGKYAKSADGWVKIAETTQERTVENLEAIIGEKSDGDLIRISKMNFLRMLSVAQDSFNLGKGAMEEKIRNIMELRPALLSPRLEGFSAILRHYQETGLHWLTFLAENNLGGLLCDDMGLGKTHQTMALMIAMKEEMGETRPFLVVCPTTVIGHWEDKIARFAPGLRPIVFHGTKREMEREFLPGDVLLTSYGIMRIDIEDISAIEFGLVVFDEIQCIKNKDTLSYRAASKLKRRMALGLSGTPIENSLLDLKSLMDLALPGYLGDDKTFEREYLEPSESSAAERQRWLLRRAISPFTLRRLKSSVLTELPPKIEDTRKCELSPEQIKLYKETLDIKAGTIRKELLNPGGEIPYIHIFALLNLLKQICNHPALVEGKPENYLSRASGKWELFTEILNEALGSGQKVVVFSQYLDMIEIIRLHLCSMAVGHVVLTGNTTDRTKLIREFNSTPECRVFVGSLKAGGMGIDLVAASVVIHYDRWWNSAREEQATDRVHRIGQTRGVQVFKFITEGTLEERIDSIIARKKSMLNEIVGEDDAGVLKSLTRKEFLEMLKAPSAL